MTLRVKAQLLILLSQVKFSEKIELYDSNIVILEQIEFKEGDFYGVLRWNRKVEDTEILRHLFKIVRRCQKPRKQQRLVEVKSSDSNPELKLNC
jgi:hypothetical protein